MMASERADSLVDDGLDDEETMFVRIPLGRLKLSAKAVAPCLGFRRPTDIDGGWDRRRDRLGDHNRTLTIGPALSKWGSIVSFGPEGAYGPSDGLLVTVTRETSRRLSMVLPLLSM